MKEGPKLNLTRYEPYYLVYDDELVMSERKIGEWVRYQDVMDLIEKGELVTRDEHEARMRSVRHYVEYVDRSRR